jgi:hypothetical protein
MLLPLATYVPRQTFSYHGYAIYYPLNNKQNKGDGMFGRDNQQDGVEDNSVPVSVVSTTTDTSTTPVQTVAMTQDEISLPAPAPDPTMPTAAAPSDDGAPEFIETPVAPHMSMPEPTPDEELSSPAITINTSGIMSNLKALKQEALHELSPLIGQLDQTPDEKYATAKMVYEETNDQALLTSVYEAAKNLPDEKEKAEAIYDVIQKINALA